MWVMKTSDPDIQAKDSVTLMSWIIGPTRSAWSKKSKYSGNFRKHTDILDKIFFWYSTRWW